MGFDGIYMGFIWDLYGIYMGFHGIYMDLYGIWCFFKMDLTNKPGMQPTIDRWKCIF